MKNKTNPREKIFGIFNDAPLNKKEKGLFVNRRK